MPRKGAPNFGLIFATQGMSVIGDAFGQRVKRTCFASSNVHMILTFSVVSALQMFLVLGFLELVLPSSITGPIYIDGEQVKCYQELDVEGHTYDCDARAFTDNPCHEIECPPQGPSSMFIQIYYHPGLLCGCILNIAYYTFEMTLYGHPMGLILLVLASLCSSFLIYPMAKLFGVSAGHPAPVVVLLLGILGAMLCIFERKDHSGSSTAPVSASSRAEMDSVDIAGEGTSVHAVITNATAITHRKTSGAHESDSIREDESLYLLWRRSGFSGRSVAQSIVHHIQNLLIPFFGLSICYAGWFVAMVYFNDKYRCNAWGYNSIDQILLPFYMYPYIYLVDKVPRLRNVFRQEGDQHEDFRTSLRTAWSNLSMSDMFLYRLLINGRAFVYFYFTVLYDLDLVYLVITLVRIVMSWLGALIVTLVIPKFIAATIEEKRVMFSPINLSARLLGSLLIGISLLLLRVVYNAT